MSDIRVALESWKLGYDEACYVADDRRPQSFPIETLTIFVAKASLLGHSQEPATEPIPSRDGQQRANEVSSTKLLDIESDHG